MLSAASIIVAICATYFVHGQFGLQEPPPTRKPTNRPTWRPTPPTPPPSPFSRITLLRTNGFCGGGPGPCIPNCDAACSASNTSPYTCPSWAYDDYRNNNKCRCQNCAYQCTKNDLANKQYDVEQCKFDPLDYEENNIGPAVADLLFDLAGNLASGIKTYGPFIQAGMEYSKGIFDMVLDETGGNPMMEAIQAHTEKNNEQMVKCMDQKISKAVTDNIANIMQESWLSYRVAKIYKVEDDLSNADEKLDRLYNAWHNFLTAIGSRFDDVLNTAQEYKDLLLPLQDFVRAFELLSLDYLTYMHALDSAANYQNNFATTVGSAQVLLAWVKRARDMIVDQEFRSRMYELPCSNDGEMEQYITEWENQFDADNVHPIMNFIRDLHELNKLFGSPACSGACADTLYYGTCGVGVVSIRHIHTNGGKYFHFDKTALDAVLGRSDWHNEKLKVSNGKEVIVWRSNANGGWKGDAHGRYDPYSTAKDGDWADGDKITFSDCKGLWRKGKAGATCDQTCNAISRRCESDMQSGIRSCADIAATASKAGVTCAHHSTCYGRTDRDRAYAGTPFISARDGFCYFLSDGAQSVCNSNQDTRANPEHQPFCYCV